VTLSVVSLYESNFRNPASALRSIADKIDAGDFGEVQTVAVALRANSLEVFGIGKTSDWPAVAMTLHAGFSKIAGEL